MPATLITTLTGNGPEINNHASNIILTKAQINAEAEAEAEVSVSGSLPVVQGCNLTTQVQGVNSRTSDQLVKQPEPQRGHAINKAMRIMLVVLLLLGCTLLLSACAYPGQDAPCAGANRNAPGCGNPAQEIKDEPQGGDWYIDWAFKIVRGFLSSVAINSVKLGINIFWEIFTNLSSTDFASCGSNSSSGGGGSNAGSGGTGNNPTCTTVGVFNTVNTIAVMFLPMILAWKFFKSYFVGSLIDSAHESALSFVSKAVIAGFVLYFLAVLVSGAFGLSNILFEAIISGPQTLNEISTNIVGNSKTSGVGSVGEVQNLGLLLFITIICLLVSAVFILLGLVFFLRTVLVFILFALSPLAIVAGLTEEFRTWFYRWLESLQAMLIAPIPVAICLALVRAFTGTIPSAKGNPPEFILQLIYVIAFLAIGCILMWKVAGQVGGLAFGLAAAGMGWAAGAGMASLGFSGARQSSNKSNKGGQSSKPLLGGNPTGSSASNLAGNINNGGSGSDGNGISSNPASSVEVLPAYSAAASLPGASSTAGAEQQQRQLLGSLRALNENMSSLNFTRTTSTTTSNANANNNNSPSALATEDSPVQDQGQVVKAKGFNRNAAFNVQSGLLWAGREAGVSAPYFKTGQPQHTGFGSGSGNSNLYGNGNGNGHDNPGPGAQPTCQPTTTTSETYNAQTYSRSEEEVQPVSSIPQYQIPGPGPDNGEAAAAGTLAPVPGPPGSGSGGGQGGTGSGSQGMVVVPEELLDFSNPVEQEPGRVEVHILNKPGIVELPAGPRTRQLIIQNPQKTSPGPNTGAIGLLPAPSQVAAATGATATNGEKTRLGQGGNTVPIRAKLQGAIPDPYGGAEVDQQKKKLKQE